MCIRTCTNVLERSPSTISQWLDTVGAEVGKIISQSEYKKS